MESGGSVVIEAGNYYQNISRNGTTWTFESLVSGYSGGGYYKALPDAGVTYLSSPYASSSPEMQYRASFTTTGTYNIWARINAPDLGGDSVHVGLDGSEVATADKIKTDPTVGSWELMRL